MLSKEDLERIPTPREVMLFGLLMIPFGAALGGIVLWRGEALQHVGFFLGFAWFLSMLFNGQDRLGQMRGLLIPSLCYVLGYASVQVDDRIQVAVAVWVVFGTLGLAIMVFQRLGVAVYRNWMMAGAPIGWTLTQAVMMLVFYLVVTPIGLIMKAVGRDQMNRKLEPKASTYWIERKAKVETDRYFKQF